MPIRLDIVPIRLDFVPIRLDFVPIRLDFVPIRVDFVPIRLDFGAVLKMWCIFGSILICFIKLVYLLRVSSLALSIGNRHGYFIILLNSSKIKQDVYFPCNV